MKLSPLSDRIVVKQLEAESTTRGGIVLPEVSKERPCMGVVISVGPGEYHEAGEFIKMDIEEGSTVMYARYGGSDVTFDAVEYTILRRSDIIGIVEK